MQPLRKVKQLAAGAMLLFVCVLVYVRLSAAPVRAFGNLKQWLVGTHHGVSRAQLQVYLDEFAFRHNRRRTPAAAFQTLLGLGSGRAPTPYRRIRGAQDLTAA